jgi:hypothetical protein
MHGSHACGKVQDRSAPARSALSGYGSAQAARSDCVCAPENHAEFLRRWRYVQAPENEHKCNDAPWAPPDT